MCELTLLGITLIVVAFGVLKWSLRKEKVDLSFLPDDLPKDYEDKQN